MEDSTLRAPTPMRSTDGRLVLRVTAGPDTGTSIPLIEPILVGTSETCQLRLSDPLVSRRHLLVSPGKTGVRLHDEGSTNGTWIRETRVQDVEIPTGVAVRAGACQLVVELMADATEPRQEPMQSSFGRFMGSAPSLAPLYRRLTRAAASDVSILLEGESGTGKELLAEAIHERSPRSSGPFVVVDCGALPPALLEAELFGHERGAFTGADRARPGAFEVASSGTVLLDEVAELPLAAQTRLLRVLDRGRVKRLGARSYVDVNVRVIAATHRNLDREVEDGRFRLDLFHRLAVILARVPPLREREEDIEPLARSFLLAVGGNPEALSEELLERLRLAPWPGNVRQLRNFIEGFAVLGEVPTEDPGREASTLQALARTEDPWRIARKRLVRRFGALYAEEMLRRHGGNVAAAAEASGIARRHFQRLRSAPPRPSSEGS